MRCWSRRAGAGPGQLQHPHRHRRRVPSVSAGETTCARLLLGSLHEGMLLLADRNFAAGFLAAQIAAAGADFRIRVRTGNSAPKLPVLCRLPDGSWLSRFGGVPVRVIDAEITVPLTPVTDPN